MLQASVHIVRHTVCHKDIHDSKIPAENYHKILVNGRKNWVHSTLSQQKTREKLNGQEEDGNGEQMTRTRST